MSEAQSADLVWVILCLVLVGSAVLSRKWSVRSAIGMALNWGLIFAGAILLFSYRGEIMMMFDRVKSELLGESQQQVSGGTVTVPMSADGHFWLDGDVNGVPVRFLVDTGASVTAMSTGVARQAGLETDGLPVALQTANGTIEAERTRIDQLSVGSIQASGLSAIVSPSFGDINVIGMNFLSQLKSWRVEGKRLILEAKRAGTED